MRQINARLHRVQWPSGRGAVAVTEIELGKVAVKVLLAAPLVHTAHPALHDGKEAFDGVGVNVADNVFADQMADALVRGELLADAPVDIGGVGQQAAFPRNIIITPSRCANART
jgi:hypothetical protein